MAIDWGSIIGAVMNYYNQRQQFNHMGDALPLSPQEQWKFDMAQKLFNYSPTRAMMGNGAEQTAGMFNASRNYNPTYKSDYMRGQEGAMPKLPAFDTSYIHAFYQPMGTGGAGGSDHVGGGGPNRTPAPPGSGVPPRDQQPYMGSNGRNGGDLGGWGTGFDNSPAGHANDIPDWAYDARTGFNDADREHFRTLMRVAPGIIGALSGLPVGSMASAFRALWDRYAGSQSRNEQAAAQAGYDSGHRVFTDPGFAPQGGGGGSVTVNDRYGALGDTYGGYNNAWGTGLAGGSSAGTPAQQPGDEFTDPFLY